MRARTLWAQAGISAAGVLLLCIGLSTISPPDCSPSAPCRPDLLTAFAVACLAAVCVVGWFHPFVAAFAALVGAAAAISPVVQYSPPMLVLVLVAYVLLIFGLALVTRRRRIDPGGARVPVPGSFTVPRFTLATGFAGALLALAVGTLVFGLVRQEQATQPHVNGALVEPVAEAYTSAVWVGVGVFLAWLALGLWARTRQRLREWQDLLFKPQPRLAAWYVPAQAAIYPRTVAVGDKPLAGAAIPVQDSNVVVEPITLYGSGIPGDLFVAATPDEIVAARLTDPPKRARWLLHRDDLERFLHRFDHLRRW